MGEVLKMKRFDIPRIWNYTKLTREDKLELKAYINGMIKAREEPNGLDEEINRLISSLQPEEILYVITFLNEIHNDPERKMNQCNTEIQKGQV